MAPHLPDELLLHIFSYLISWENSAWQDYGVYPKLDERGSIALTSLCKACRRFKFLAEPILYSVWVKPENRCKRKEPNTLFQPSIHEPCLTLRKYLRTLIERPDLASHVKVLQIQAWETEETLKGEWSEEGESYEATTLPPSAPMAHSFYETASQLLPDGPARREWLIALCRGDEDAEVALLLALLGNLQALQIVLPNVSGSDEYHFFFFHRVVREALNSSKISKMHSFPHLKSLDVRSYSLEDSDIGLPIYPFSDFFKIAELKAFNGHHMVADGDPNEWGEWTCDPGLSAVRHLRLKDIYMSSEAIATLIISCSKLESLEVYFNTTPNDSLPFEWAEIYEALQRHKSTLKTISIDIYADAIMVDSYDEPISSLGGFFKDFISLRHLEIQQSALTGANLPDDDDEDNLGYNLLNVLPPSLESFGILNSDVMMESHLERLARDLSYFPHLRKVRVGSSDGYGPRHLYVGEESKHRERTDNIKRAFEAAGIEWEDPYREAIVWENDGQGGAQSILDTRDVEV